MTITCENALVLGKAAIRAIEAMQADEKQPFSFSAKIECQTLNDLNVFLKEERQDFLYKDAHAIDFEEKTVWIFPNQELLPDKWALYARGLDAARALIAILKHAGKENALNKVQTALAAFHKRITLGMMPLKELELFHGVLIDLLTEQNIIANEKQGIKALEFVRDVLWREDFYAPFCTVDTFKPTNTNSEYPKQYLLRYNEPLTFEEIEYKKDKGAPLNYWKAEEPWKKKLKHAVDKQDQWLSTFLKVHLETMRTRSSTAMTRYTPNLANASLCADIILKKKDDQSDLEISNLGNYTRHAILEPLKLSKTASRQPLAEFNLLQLLNEDFINNTIKGFLENWGPLLEKNKEIPITILHQTLVGAEVTLTPDQRKTSRSSILESKEQAQEAAKQLFNKYNLYWTGEHIEFTPKEKVRLNVAKVKIQLSDINNCVNMWHTRARRRNQDIINSRKLIDELVKLAKKVTPQNTDLDIIIQFLESSNHSLFTPYKSRGEKVKRALNTLTTTELAQFPTQSAKENFLLSISAAVELKCTIHETWAGACRRNIANFTRDYFRPIYGAGQIADLAIRGGMSFLSILIKGLGFLFVADKVVKHRQDRKEIYKSVYEHLLAQSIGAVHGGCMSALDRAGEVGEQVAAMRKHFAIHNRLLGYNDSKKDKKAFFQEANTYTKHIQATLSTGANEVKDSETQGISPPINLLSSNDNRKNTVFFKGTRNLPVAPIKFEKYVSEFFKSK